MRTRTETYIQSLTKQLLQLCAQLLGDALAADNPKHVSDVTKTIPNQYFILKYCYQNGFIVYITFNFIISFENKKVIYC